MPTLCICRSATTRQGEGRHQACWAGTRAMVRARLPMLSSHQLRLVWD
jgi:hypothetical protein